MWYNPLANLLKKEQEMKSEEDESIKKLRDSLIPLRRQLQYLASYRCSHYKEPNFRFSDFK